MSYQLIPNRAPRRDWEKVTDGWRKWSDKFSKQSSGATKAILEMVEVREGLRVLDIACGGGEPSLSLAKAVGPSGNVVATDIVPGMLETVQGLARNENLCNIQYRIADAEAIPFPGESFDAVTCRFGVMFFSNPEKAMKEALRVLKNKGIVALVTWGSLEKNPRFTTTTSIVRKYLDSAQAEIPSQSRTASDELFKFANHGSLSKLLRGADFSGNI